MINRVLAFFHYAVLAAVPVFLIMLLDGVLWPEVLPNVGPSNPFAIPLLILLLVLLSSLFVFVVRIAVDAAYREACFRGLVGLHERDEREALIVGTAARHTLLLSLALLVGLLIANLFDVSFNQHGLQQIGMDKRLTDLVVLPWSHGEDTVFRVMPLTRTGILVFMVVLQVLAFRYFSRRAARRAK